MVTVTLGLLLWFLKGIGNWQVGTSLWNKWINNVITQALFYQRNLKGYINWL